MKIKTANLTGPALDWAVCVCEGESPSRYTQYSTDWSQGGPIIEREKIELTDLSNQETGYEWGASIIAGGKNMVIHRGYGPTALIAAMRCFVASRLGDEVEVPDELL